MELTLSREDAATKLPEKKEGKNVRFEDRKRKKSHKTTPTYWLETHFGKTSLENLNFRVVKVMVVSIFSLVRTFMEKAADVF